MVKTTMQETIKACLITLDFDLYPRSGVSSQNVSYLVDALESGATLPPILIDKKSKRCIDGFHRTKAYIRAYGQDFDVPVEQRNYKNDAAMFLDAALLNATHGQTLTRFDRAHCLLKGEQLGVDPEEMASVLSLTVTRAGELRVQRTGKLHGSSTPIILKRTITHMRGKTLSKSQEVANKSLSGMNQVFYVNQVITLIENDLLNNEDVKLMTALSKLHELLKKMKFSI